MTSAPWVTPRPPHSLSQADLEESLRSAVHTKDKPAAAAALTELVTRALSTPSE
jgi:hypothetical protein